MRIFEVVPGNRIGVSVLVNREPAEEYSVSGPQLQQECWIPVGGGDTLSVRCDTTMNTEYFQVDLVVDGVMRNSFGSTKVTKNLKRIEDIMFAEGVYKFQRSLHRSTLKVSRLGRGTLHSV